MSATGGTATWIESGPDLPIDAAVTVSTPLVGPSPAPADGPALLGPEPQAFIVRMGARTDTLPVHFHPVDQFQLVVAGSGRLREHRVAPAALQYADRFQPYGPITAGPEGLAFLTLRTTSDSGAFYMPGSREELALRVGELGEEADRRRNVTVDLDAALRNGGRAGVDGWTDAVSEADGLRAAVTSVAPGGRSAAVTVAGVGAYAVVLGGEARDGGAVAVRGSVCWFPPGDTVPAVDTGPDGVTLALLQFPERPAS